MKQKQFVHCKVGPKGISSGKLRRGGKLGPQTGAQAKAFEGAVAPLRPIQHDHPSYILIPRPGEQIEEELAIKLVMLMKERGMPSGYYHPVTMHRPHCVQPQGPGCPCVPHFYLQPMPPPPETVDESEPVTTVQITRFNVAD